MLPLLQDYPKAIEILKLAQIYTTNHRILQRFMYIYI